MMYGANLGFVIDLSPVQEAAPKWGNTAMLK